MHTLKYQDTSLITDIYTEQMGRASFLIPVTRSRKSAVKSVLFQPLALVEIVADIRPNVSIYKVREAKSFYPFASLPYHPLKSAIALFLAEFLYRALRSAYTEKVDSVVNSISDAKYDDYHAASKRLALYYDGAAEELTQLSASRAKYELNMEYGLLTSHQMPREYTADTDELKLQSHFDGTPHATTAGWCYTAGVLLLVLCPYFATRRSRRVTALSGGIFGRQKRTFTHDGGIDIC